MFLLAHWISTKIVTVDIETKINFNLYYYYLLQSHSPRSSPNTSPRAHEPSLPHTPHSAPPSTYNSYNYPQRAASAPPTPGESLSSLSGDVTQAFGHTSSSMIMGAPSAASSVRSLRQDLLVAADSVTNAMSSLVKELNSGEF